MRSGNLCARRYGVGLEPVAEESLEGMRYLPAPDALLRVLLAEKDLNPPDFFVLFDLVHTARSENWYWEPGRFRRISVGAMVARLGLAQERVCESVLRLERLEVLEHHVERPRLIDGTFINLFAVRRLVAPLHYPGTLCRIRCQDCVEEQRARVELDSAPECRFCGGKHRRVTTSDHECRRDSEDEQARHELALPPREWQRFREHQIWNAGFGERPLLLPRWLQWKLAAQKLNATELRLVLALLRGWWRARATGSSQEKAVVRKLPILRRISVRQVRRAVAGLAARGLVGRSPRGAVDVSPLMWSRRAPETTVSSPTSSSASDIDGVVPRSDAPIGNSPLREYEAEPGSSARSRRLIGLCPPSGSLRPEEET